MVENGWTKRVKRDEEKIRWLTYLVDHQHGIIEAQAKALKIREKLIEDTITNLTAERQANQRWTEFAHKAVSEMAEYRELLIQAGYDPDHIKEERINGN